MQFLEIYRTLNLRYGGFRDRTQKPHSFMSYMTGQSIIEKADPTEVKITKTLD